MSQASMHSQERGNDASAAAGDRTRDPKAQIEQQLRQGQQGATDTAESLKQQGQKVVSGAKAQAAQAAEDLKTAAYQGVEQAKSQTVQMLERQKSNAACCVTSIEDALRSASKTLRDEQNAPAASVADAAANRLHGVASYLDQRPLGDLMADVEEITRRRPEVVLGGLFVAGLAAARFLKASSRGPSRSRAQATVIRHPQAYHV